MEGAEVPLYFAFGGSVTDRSMDLRDAKEVWDEGELAVLERTAVVHVQTIWDFFRLYALDGADADCGGQEAVLHEDSVDLAWRGRGYPLGAMEGWKKRCILRPLHEM